GYTATRLHGYTATRLHGYTATRLHGYTATRLHGYTATRLSLSLKRSGAEAQRCRDFFPASGMFPTSCKDRTLHRTSEQGMVCPNILFNAFLRNARRFYNTIQISGGKPHAQEASCITLYVSPFILHVI
ncbi:MAG: hypothetical protein LBD91_00345, partial [Prevotellaceae bacterium]|nr:hypothetical protein [Prevotellaceae bacterium]